MSLMQCRTRTALEFSRTRRSTDDRYYYETPEFDSAHAECHQKFTVSTSVCNSCPQPNSPLINCLVGDHPLNVRPTVNDISPQLRHLTEADLLYRVFGFVSHVYHSDYVKYLFSIIVIASLLVLVKYTVITISTTTGLFYIVDTV